MTGEPRDHGHGDPHPEPPEPDRSASGGAGNDSAPGDSSRSLSGSSSGDELSALLSESIVEPHPDPFLGEFTSRGSASSPPPPADPAENAESESFDALSALIAFSDPNAVQPTPGPPGVPSAPRPAGDTPDSFEALSALTPLGSDSSSAEVAVPNRLVGEASSEPSSAEALSALDLTAPAVPRHGPAELEAQEEDDEDDEDDVAPRGNSWLTLLLVSYASAVTLGLLWVLFSGRKLRETESDDVFPPVDNRPDPGRRADRSRKVVARPPLIADHLTTIGKPVRIGSIEATPLEIVQGRVDLNPAFAEVGTRDGGSGALKLKLRLKNVSTDLILAPLDEAYLRERDPRVLDSFIETAKNVQIPMYPLAVSSEMSIAGQDFRELRPGESFETLVVSAADVADRLTDEMTWQIRLRTGILQTDTLGVRFKKTEIVPGS